MANSAIPAGSNRTIITTATTTQARTGPGIVARVVIANVGTTATLDIYDDTSGTANKIYEWVSADGKRNDELGIRCYSGIKIVSGGTFGRAIITWEG